MEAYILLYKFMVRPYGSFVSSAESEANETALSTFGVPSKYSRFFVTRYNSIFFTAALSTLYIPYSRNASSSMAEQRKVRLKRTILFTFGKPTSWRTVFCLAERSFPRLTPASPAFLIVLLFLEKNNKISLQNAFTILITEKERKALRGSISFTFGLRLIVLLCLRIFISYSSSFHTHKSSHFYLYIFMFFIFFFHYTFHRNSHFYSLTFSRMLTFLHHQEFF